MGNIMKLFTKSINRVVVKLALISFVGGTLLFVLYIAFETDVLFFMGIIHVVLALLVNSIFFVFAFLNLLFEPKKFKENILAITIQLLNIPIALFYFYLMTNFFVI